MHQMSHTGLLAVCSVVWSLCALTCVLHLEAVHHV